ncbi:MAG TPA: DUF262 domain-containing protein [Streptosporangiaceae bacterium]|jgi:hypothetical protein
MATLDRPHVEYKTPVDLVRQIQRGALRIPAFQRDFKWQPSDVVKLFDSLNRGFPVGNLLLWRRPAPAQLLTIGPVEIDAPETESALWVVDGQQRITSIVGALIAAQDAADPRFRIYLNLDDGSFHSMAARQNPPLPWLPVSQLLDTTTLLRWMRVNADLLSEGQIAKADQAAKAIREYQVPAYVVSSDDEEVLVEIFNRMNDTGKRLSRADSFQALHSGLAGTTPTGLSGIGQVPARLGFGVLDDRLVLRCLLAVHGGNIFRDDFHGMFATEDDRVAAFDTVARLLRPAVRLLQEEIGVPHVRVLPYTHVLPILVRFLHLHGEPDARVVVLLRRWAWRGAVAGAKARGISVADIRAQVRAVEGPTAMKAAGHLLKLVPNDAKLDADLRDTHLNHAMARINVLGLLSAGPRDLGSGQPVDIAALLASGSPLQAIVPDRQNVVSTTIANRLVGPAMRSRVLLRALSEASPEVAESHFLNVNMQMLLRGSRDDDFLQARAAAVSAAIQDHVDTMAEWGARDGLSISAVIRPVA